MTDLADRLFVADPRRTARHQHTAEAMLAALFRRSAHDDNIDVGPFQIPAAGIARPLLPAIENPFAASLVQFSDYADTGRVRSGMIEIRGAALRTGRFAHRPSREIAVGRIGGRLPNPFLLLLLAAVPSHRHKTEAIHQQDGCKPRIYGGLEGKALQVGVLPIDRGGARLSVRLVSRPLMGRSETDPPARCRRFNVTGRHILELLLDLDRAGHA